MKPCVRPGWFWLDADALADYAATRTGDEQRVVPPGAVVDPWTSRRPDPGPEGRRVSTVGVAVICS